MTGDGIADMMDNIMAQVYEYKIVAEIKQAEQNPQAEVPKAQQTVDLRQPRKSMKGKNDEEETP